MSYEPKAFSFAGRDYELPRLPWRLSKQVQPALMQVLSQFGGASAPALAALPSAEYDRLGEAVRLALTSVDASMTREAFGELPIGLADLVAAIPAVCLASGLSMRDADGAEAPSDTGK